jgi:hypothetical protein
VPSDRNNQKTFMFCGMHAAGQMPHSKGYGGGILLPNAARQGQRGERTEMELVNVVWLLRLLTPHPLWFDCAAAASLVLAAG